MRSQSGGSRGEGSVQPLVCRAVCWRYAIYISVLIQLKSRLRQDNESSATCQEAERVTKRRNEIKNAFTELPLGLVERPCGPTESHSPSAPPLKLP